MGKYEGKRVVITGGTSGIGLATARRLLSEGSRVLVTGRSGEGLAAARRELGPDAIVVESDAASLAAIDALASRIKADLDAVDALIVCAGQTRFIPFADMTEAAFDELLAVNAKGPYFTVQKLAPLMTAASGIVFVTSIANITAQPMISAYAASKAALRSMTRSLARELLPRGIRVNALSPGAIDSGILQKVLPPHAVEPTQQQMMAAIPMQRLGSPDEIAAALIFLAFEATYNIGTELIVDGGVTQL